VHLDAAIVADLVDRGLRSWWAPGLAFLAGVVSFASPCVFPLVPGYLSFVAGGEAKDEKRPIVPILLFIAGFAAVFTALGAFTGSITRILRSSAGIRISGLLIVTFGVLMFGAGWTPCIGPVLAGVLALAAAQGGSLRGALLLFTYSLGLGVPFLLVGLGIRLLMDALGFVKRNYHWIVGLSGVVMVAIGVLVATNTWTRLLGPVMRSIQNFNPPL
jgi:cytochrome c-type biogenesis protein